jgi:hypothetical protein
MQADAGRRKIISIDVARAPTWNIAGATEIIWLHARTVKSNDTGPFQLTWQ